MKKLLLATFIFCFLTVPLALAQEASDPLVTPFELKINGESRELSLAQLGVQAEKRESFSFLEKVLSHTFLIKELIKIPTYEFAWDTQKSEALLRTQFQLSFPKDASLHYENNTLILNEAVSGLQVPVDALIQKLVKSKSKKMAVNLEPAPVIPTENFTPHLEAMEILLDQGLLIQVEEATHIFPVQLKDIELDDSLQLTDAFMDYVLKTLAPLVNQPAENIRILEANTSETSRSVSEGHLRNGRQLLAKETAELIQANVAQGVNVTPAQTAVLEAQILNETGLDLGPLNLIAQGRSNFAGSIPGRDFNVRKGLNEKINGVLIPPGAEYSFNTFLDGPVTYSNGWKGAYAIFGGANLELVPGGGICQTSTTVYRAALNAGLEMVEHRAHSLYVDYYEAYGNGLDATIFPGVQDLVFINNTPNFIYIEAYDDGHDAIVNFYGESDGRKVTLKGPYTTNNQTEEMKEGLGRYIRYYEIAWKHIIEWPDGTVQEEWILNTYNSGVKQNNDPVD